MMPKPYKTFSYFSIFSAHIEKYIAIKRAYGFRYNIQAVYLKQFDSFCIEHQISSVGITSELMDMWSIKRQHENDTNFSMRIRMIREFSKFLHKSGITSLNEFHPLPKVSKEFIPYIFTKEELERFFQAVDKNNIKKKTVSPVKHIVLPVLFRLLYCCGLRISEACMLKTKNVDLHLGIIDILDSKGGSNRKVVLSESVRNLCIEYRNRKEIQEFTSEYFFPAPDHMPYSHSTMYNLFRKYLFDSKIPHHGRGKGPRLHDLRHTFAVHVLSKWQNQDKDLYICLPVLIAYLGHKRLTCTEKYLRLVPENYKEITGAFDQTFGCIFPEVRHE